MNKRFLTKVGLSAGYDLLFISVAELREIFTSIAELIFDASGVKRSIKWRNYSIQVSKLKV